MSDRRIAVFFYGLFMDPELLRGKGVAAPEGSPAVLEGFGLRIGRRATLVASAGERSYGMLMRLTPGDIDALYAGPGLDEYRPEAVPCTTLGGEMVCALCYTLPAAPAPGEANPEYAEKLREVLGRLGFPEDYIARVR